MRQKDKAQSAVESCQKNAMHRVNKGRMQGSQAHAHRGGMSDAVAGYPCNVPGIAQYSICKISVHDLSSELEQIVAQEHKQIGDGAMNRTELAGACCPLVAPTSSMRPVKSFATIRIVIMGELS
jgi:hypothetical protein